MAVIRCPHGHYYDDNRFSSCPHCGISAGAEEPPRDAGRPKEAKERKGLWKWMDRDKTVALSQEKEAGPGQEEGETISLEALAGSEAEDDQRTIGYYSGAKGNDYVVGWLVCTDGPEKGRDYRLHHGFNRIGRDMDMDVQVMDDPAITRKNHCSVVYDEVSCSFSAVAGSGTLTYYNNNLLAKAQALQAGDEIRMGNSTFVFIPFCKEGRVWEREDES